MLVWGPFDLRNLSPYEKLWPPMTNGTEDGSLPDYRDNVMLRLEVSRPQMPNPVEVGN